MSDTLGPLMERNLLEVFGQRGDGITVLLLQRGSLEVTEPTCRHVRFMVAVGSKADVPRTWRNRRD